MDSSAALWAPDNSGSKTPNDPAMVPFALTGFLIKPIPDTPDTLSSIPIVDLLFESDHPRSGFTYGSAVVSTGYQVTATQSGADDTDLSIVITGAQVFCGETRHEQSCGSTQHRRPAGHANDNNLVVSNFKGRTAVFENIPYQVGATGASTSDSIVRPIESNSSASRMNFP